MAHEILKQIKILFVDDDATMVSVAEDILAPLCKDLQTAKNGKEALDLFYEQEDFDLIITDIEMPVMNGLELIAKIREDDSHFPITITSAYSELRYLNRAINLGVNGYISKPIDLNILIDTIDRVVEGRVLRKQLEQFNHELVDQLKERTSELNTILNTQENIIVVTTDTDIHTVNRSYLDFYGVEDFETVDHNIRNFFSSFIEDSAYFSCKEEECTKEFIKRVKDSKEDVYVKIVDYKGKEHIFKLQMGEYTQKEDHYVFSLTDITAIKNESDHFEHRATHDALTTIYNRQYFTELLSNELNRVSRYNSSFTLIMFDIDYFKNINDTYGHDVGDVVLQTLSQVVKDSLRTTDIFARWGGEEFMIFMPETPIDNAKTKVESLKKLIDTSKLSTMLEKPVTISFGVTEVKKDDTLKSILKKVDVALYMAKEKGRNRIEII